MLNPNDTIAAVATASGVGGIGIVRVSGSKVTAIAQTILGELPQPRYAHHCAFKSASGETLDEGVALYFAAPNSFTGEDVLELQGHGGSVVLDRVLKACLAAGARLANPGEFSERAFLNNKIDLTQAEAIADLINSSSEQAARSAISSLQGQFSNKIHGLVAALIKLRTYVEACIDFPEEEIDFLTEGAVAEQLHSLIEQVSHIKTSAKQGILLQEGMTVVLAGRPNAGKSSLLNQLSGQDSAIVTDIPGTTRDLVRAHIQIDGMPVHIIDTAGLRDSKDAIEQEGIKRAITAMQSADQILYLVDSTQPDLTQLPTELNIPITIIQNKIDLTKTKPTITTTPNSTTIKLSAKTGEGITLLRNHLKQTMGYQSDQQNHFIARRRHLDAIDQALNALHQGKTQLAHQAGECLAEDLTIAQQALATITGEFTTEDLLGEIFSSFCIGK